MKKDKHFRLSENSCDSLKRLSQELNITETAVIELILSLYGKSILELKEKGINSNVIQEKGKTS